MSKSKLMIPVPALKTLDELEETPNETSNTSSLEPNATVYADGKSKRNSNSNTARSSSSIVTINNTTNIKHTTLLSQHHRKQAGNRLTSELSLARVLSTKAWYFRFFRIFRALPKHFLAWFCTKTQYGSDQSNQ